MQIRNIFARQSDSSAISRNETAADKSASATLANAVEESPMPPGRVAQEILSKYDITSISPKEFTEMLQKLHSALAISDKDFQNLSQVRQDLERDGIAADEEIDLLSFYSDKVRRAEAEEGNTELAALRSRLQWLQKASLVQGTSEPTWLDAAA